MSHHRFLTRALLIGGLAAPTLIAAPQDPADGPTRSGGAASSADLVTRMMKFDRNKDGKLSKAEITDARLVRIWTRADADKNGTVTKSELEAVDTGDGGNAGGPGGGPGGPGGGPGGPGGPMGSPPKPGEILPQMMRSRLKLTSDQQAKLDDLQRDVDAKMAKILTDNQKAQLKQMSTRGPGGGRGGPGGPGGRGGPGGPDGFPGNQDGQPNFPGGQPGFPNNQGGQVDPNGGNGTGGFGFPPQ